MECLPRLEFERGHIGEGLRNKNWPVSRSLDRHHGVVEGRVEQGSMYPSSGKLSMVESRSRTSP